MPHLVAEIFLWLFGLCVGSFLNVIVYRLSAGLSIARPVWSFCPQCRAVIAWYDNLPVLSWLLLRGRCRHCHGRISLQYPLVESLTGLLFVLAYHLLFVNGARAGMPGAVLWGDGPLLLAWLALVSCLVACSAMDITSYVIDIRVTNLVVVAGIVACALWPRASFVVPRAQTGAGAAALAAFVFGGVALFLLGRRDEEEDEARQTAPDEAVCTVLPDVSSRGNQLGGMLAVGLFAGIAGWAAVTACLSTSAETGAAQRPVAAALLTIFVVTALVGGQPRAADEEIANAIHEERFTARRTVLAELKWLLVPVVAGTLAFALVDGLPAVGRAWERIVGWTPVPNLAPAGGAVWAIHGAVIGAAAGWLLRIVFTLIYGREAFGVGDIYILAAAGATAGWDIALLGLLLSVGIALAGWLLGLLFKRTGMIPFGPWLAIGFVLALWWNRPAQHIAEVYSRGLRQLWRDQPQMLVVAGGLMLVASAAAIVFSRLVRHWLVPDSDEGDESGEAVEGEGS